MTVPLVVVTGAAGFIGAHLVRRLRGDGVDVLPLDAWRAGYPRTVQEQRVRALLGEDHGIVPLDVAEPGAVSALLHARAEGRPVRVVHLAARAGVRASTDDPAGFVRANVLGFTEVLEACRVHAVEHLVYASSSSVYGGLEKVPFTPHDPTDHPQSVYAATKKADELLAHAYAHLHGLPATGLRFFTVYGRWGRPDMAYWRFAEALLAGEPISVYGDGSALRDFTHVDDVVEALVRLLDRPPAGDPLANANAPDPATAAAPHVVHNVGHGGQVTVLELARLLADELGVPLALEHMPPPPGDVARTWADTSTLEAAVGALPGTAFEPGMRDAARWLRCRHETNGPVAGSTD